LLPLGTSALLLGFDRIAPVAVLGPRLVSGCTRFRQAEGQRVGTQGQPALTSRAEALEEDLAAVCLDAHAEARPRGGPHLIPVRRRAQLANRRVGQDRVGSSWHRAFLDVLGANGGRKKIAVA